MFSGIVTHIGTIADVKQQGDLRIAITSELPGLSVGASVAVNGACLTVVEYHAGRFAADLSDETLSCTMRESWHKGRLVNLEAPIKAGAPLDGHIVTGHVDGVATLISSDMSGDSKQWQLEAPSTLARFIAAKGSVTLDGVSLTVNKVEANRFFVNVIPHTLHSTTLGERKAGDGLNIEIDIIARYVERLMQK